MSEFKVEPGQMYQMYREGGGDVYVVVEPEQGYLDGWVTFNISQNRYEWDVITAFRTQYRRLA